MSDLNSVQRRRVAQYGWLTRASKSLELAITGRDPDKFAIEEYLTILNKRLVDVEDTQIQMESLIEDLQEIEDDIAQAAEKCDPAIQLRIRATRVLKGLIEREEDERSSISGLSQSAAKIAKLPKIELPKFDGEVTKFQEFWDQFEATIDRSDLPTVTKFTYLRGLLVGEAKATIDGFTLSEANYLVACETLKERFGRKELIVFTHIQSLLNLEADKFCRDNLSKLKSILDQVNVHVRSLQAYAIDGSTYGVVLAPVILSRLPTDIRMEWAREGKGREGDLQWLLDFLKAELERRERADTFKAGKYDKVEEVKKEKRQFRNQRTATSLHSRSSQDLHCVNCNKQSHNIDKCWSMKKMSFEDRKSCFVRNSLCFRCCSSNHSAKTCKEMCEVCSGSHHKWMCFKLKRPEPIERQRAESQEAETTTENPVLSCSSRATTHGVLLQITEVLVQSPYGNKKVNVLFDNGSDRTYVTKDLVQSLRMQTVSYVNHRYAVFGGGKTSETKKAVVDVNMVGLKQNYKVQAIEVPVICAPLERPKVPVEILKKSCVPVANYSHQGQIKIDILIGLDNYWKLMLDEFTRVEGENLVVQSTVFGKMLSGQVRGSSTRVSSGFLVLNDISESEVRRIWDVEHIGVLPKEQKSEDQILTQFKEAVSYEDGRYVVGLPWKEDKKSILQSNEGAAKERLNRLKYKLDKSPEIQEGYSKVFDEWEKMGIIEEVPEADLLECQNPVFYLPHRPVVKEHHISTKIRPVFDASAKAKNGFSLNDCLETGPNLLPDLVSVLIRFRRFQVALNADVVKAFLQIKLKAEDKDVHRFLLYTGGKLRHMRFCRVAFGVNCSPFLLNATIKYHLEQQPPSRVVEELFENLYMDDWLSGAEDTTEGGEMHREANSIMDKAGMKLSKWNTNEKEILDKESPTSESVKVLGVKWNPEVDNFQFDGVKIPNEVIATKRIVLSVLARMFDPLGFVTPVLMTGKILFQKLWSLGVDWDEEIPQDLEQEFHSWVQSLEILRAWEIPRRYLSTQWSDAVLELHVFADAAETAYGAVVYLVSSKNEGEKEASFVISKAKVAPLKKITLPRLELLSCLLAARLLSYARESLKIQQVPYRCWSDSQIALCWIRGNKDAYKPYVSNRVQEIQSLSDPKSWAHVPGKKNPADMLTRGLSAEKLVQSSWLQGPEFLIGCYNELCETESEYEMSGDMNDDEMKPKVVFSTLSEETKIQRLFEVERWSSLSKAIRIVCLVVKFITNLMKKCLEKRGIPARGDIIEEMKIRDDGSYVMNLLLLQEQRQFFHKELENLKSGGVSRSSKLFKLDPFLDEDGLLRVRGRIQQAELSYAEKHPIILDKGWLSKLIIKEKHEGMKHAGVDTVLLLVRSQYWIIGARRMIKDVIKQCLKCQRLLAKACNQIGAPLPKERVTQKNPFAVTGVDFAGPVYVMDVPGQKFYICLFTCAVVRAIHLELTASLSSAEFLHIFRRFSARRGIPEKVLSDNGKTFVGVQQKLQLLYGTVTPNWKFIVPRAPWWGGWWERMVRNVKLALKKCLGNSMVSKEELITLLVEVENVINSRPLIQGVDDVYSQRPISPNDFLLNKLDSTALDIQPVEGCTPAALNLQPVESCVPLMEIYKGKQRQLQTFWKIWSTTYLQTLPKIIPQFVETSNLKQGSVVLIQDENLPKVKWPMGRVLKTYASEDGKIRSVLLKTGNGQLTRPVQKLCHLEAVTPLPKGEELEARQSANFELKPRKQLLKKVKITTKIDSSNESQTEKKTRSGRAVKTRDILDL